MQILVKSKAAAFLYDKHINLHFVIAINDMFLISRLTLFMWFSIFIFQAGKRFRWSER